MNCYNHPKISAIRISGKCSKGVCEQCRVKDAQLIVYSSACLKIYQEVKELNERAKKYMVLAPMLVLKKT